MEGFNKNSSFNFNYPVFIAIIAIKKILDIHKFEPKKKYVEELVDTDESYATSVEYECYI